MLSRHIGGGQPVPNPIILKPTDIITYIAAASTFTSVSIANNGGKTQLTSAGVHGLTTSPAVGASVYVTWSGGTGVNGFYPVLSVDSTTAITIDLTYNAGLGTPSASLANTEVTLVSFNVPPLTASSKIRMTWGILITASTNTKSMYAKLNTTALVAHLTSGGTTTQAGWDSMIVNYGATNAQRGSWICGFPGTHSNADFAVGAVDTSVPTTLNIVGKPAAANEIIRLTMCLVEVFI